MTEGGNWHCHQQLHILRCKNKVHALAHFHMKATGLRHLMGRERCTHCRCVRHEKTCGHNRLHPLLPRVPDKTHVTRPLWSQSSFAHVCMSKLECIGLGGPYNSSAHLLYTICPRPMRSHNHLRQAWACAHAMVLHAFLCECTQHETACVRVGMEVHGAERVPWEVPMQTWLSLCLGGLNF